MRKFSGYKAIPIDIYNDEYVVKAYSFWGLLTGEDCYSKDLYNWSIREAILKRCVIPLDDANKTVEQLERVDYLKHL